LPSYCSHSKGRTFCFSLLRSYCSHSIGRNSRHLSTVPRVTHTHSQTYTKLPLVGRSCTHPLLHFHAFSHSPLPQPTRTHTHMHTHIHKHTHPHTHTHTHTQQKTTPTPTPTLTPTSHMHLHKLAHPHTLTLTHTHPTFLCGNVPLLLLPLPPGQEACDMLPTPSLSTAIAS